MKTRIFIHSQYWLIRKAFHHNQPVYSSIIDSKNSYHTSHCLFYMSNWLTQCSEFNEADNNMLIFEYTNQSRRNNIQYSK